MANAPKKRNGKSKPRRHRSLWLIAVSAVLAFCVLISISEKMEKPFLPTWNDLFSMIGLPTDEPAQVEGELRVDMLDVGNADCLLVRSGGKTMLIDAGTASAADGILQYLDDQHIDRLDYVIATHPDADHIGGMRAVLRAKEIGTFIMSYMPEEHTPTTSTYENMLETLLDKGIAVTEAAPGQRYALGEAALTILGPVGEFTDTNNQSVIAKLTLGNKSMLLTGDASKKAENALLAEYRGDELSADVLKVGHHGSSSSSQEKFLDRVGASVAIISCGADNSYGHPHEDVLTALNERNITVYRTDLHGRITLTCDGNRWHVSTER